jgi:YVTN family beta-propeller protein
VTVGRADKVAVIDTTTDTLLTMITVGTTPWGVAVAP